MAFGFGNAGGAGGSGGANNGPELETIQTDELGFQTIAGDAKVRLSSAWDPLPASTASLLTVAPRKGLVAAAGPDQVIIATTESVRKQFEAPKNGDSDIRDFEPQLKLPMPMRVSQITFTADENFLVLSAESGGGLAVYEVQSLLSGSTNSAFELPTNGESLRLLSPNPTAEKAELCAIVTTNGNLHMANLKERRISDPLKNQVSCVCWSSKGKQLCAGLADGTIHQMTPEGEAKAEISKPSDIGNHHVSTLSWLENHLWLAIYTSSNESPPTSEYRLITRTPPSSFTFQKLADPVEPFGSDKIPHHSVLRLRDYPPDLQDLLIVSSTASTDIGLLSRSKKALTTDKPADSITGVFTTTELLDDTKRATLPMTDSMEDSTPVGLAFDLSSKDKVYKPIPSDEELEESPSPLPGFWVLTHEGLLCSWWVIYIAAIKQGTTYPGLAVADTSSTVTTTPPGNPPKPASAFGSTGGGAFGSTAAATPAFGSSSQIGLKSSPWGAPSATGTASQTGNATFGSSSFGSSNATSAPAFGKPSAVGFGQSSQLGMRSSPWGSAGGGAPAFGQSGFSSFASKSPGSGTFGSPSQPSNQASAPSSGGFAGFATQGGFASVAANNSGSSAFGGDNKSSSALGGGAKPEQSSVFGGSKASSASPFASAGNTSNTGSSVFGSSNKPANPFASASKDTAFPPKTDKPSSSGVFGSTPFKLESSFKPDPSAQDDEKKPAAGSGSSMFGNAFGSALDSASKGPAVSDTASKDDEMNDEETVEQTPQAKPRQSLFATQTSPESTTPTTTPAPNKFANTSSPAPGSSIFGQPTPAPPSGSSIFAKAEPTKSTGFNFFSPKKETPQSAVPETPKSGFEHEAPLPPDTTSKLEYPLGDSSSSSTTSNPPNPAYGADSTPSKGSDAPLPPDPTATPKPGKDDKSSDSPDSAIGNEAPLPNDFVKVAKPKESSQNAARSPLPPDPIKKTKPVAESAPLPPDPTKFPSKPEPLPPGLAASKPSKEEPPVPPGPEDSNESDFEDDATEGSGVDVAKDLSPQASGMTVTPSYTPQSSFGGPGSSTTPATAQPTQDRARPLFGELSRNAPQFPRPNNASPRSPSPVRGAVPQRVLRSEATRSVSAPGMASQILGSNKPRSQLNNSTAAQERAFPAEDAFRMQQRRLKEQQEAEETRPLVDEEDDAIQRTLSSEVEGTLRLDEFIAHTNTAPPAQESIPSQVEAVYRDINSMIDTVGLNSRSVKGFVKGHTEQRKREGRTKDDLENPDEWVLCEIDELGRVLDHEVYADLEDGRVRDLDEKLSACQDLSRDMHRLRAKQEDLKKIITARMDPGQAEVTQSLPLSAEQATQQNELRREFANFSKVLAEAEEALTLLKARIASVSGSSGKGNTNMPTVEAVMRTITKMTTMVEKRSGDVDVLENQLRKLRLGSTSREGSPMVTPQARKSVIFSPESTPSRNFRHSFAASVGSIGSPARATPPRKKLSGFSKEEKSDLMEKRARRQAVLGKLKDNVEKRGVNVWNMEDIE